MLFYTWTPGRPSCCQDKMAFNFQVESDASEVPAAPSAPSAPSTAAVATVEASEVSAQEEMLETQELSHKNNNSIRDESEISRKLKLDKPSHAMWG